MEEYCVIYGGTDTNPGPFIIGVSKDQEMINGFREEHYHFCKGGEIVSDSKYECFAADYEISYKCGHYMTPKMITEFIEYLTAVYNQLSQILDTYDRNLCYLLFDENDQNVIDDGFGLFEEILGDVIPIELSEIVEDSIYGSVLQIENCLNTFISTYEPTPDF